MKKKYVVLVVLILAISITIIFSFNNKSKELDEVILNEKDNEMFAIMLQNETGYEESDSNEWPNNNYIYNSDLSGCIDKNGEKIEEEILTFDSKTRKAIVETLKTSYCYLYFDKLETFTVQQLVDSHPNNLNTEIKGGMYRYQGDYETVDNNYICFGTSDKNECTSNPDIYMYRIIGIVAEDCTNKESQICDDTVSKNMIKIMKQTPLKEDTTDVFKWNEFCEGEECNNVIWSNSMIKKRINGESNGQTKGNQGDTNIFLNSKNPLYPYMDDSTWTDKIVSKKWYEGEFAMQYALRTSLLDYFNYEFGISDAPSQDQYSNRVMKKWTQSANDFKISLISASDYNWAVAKEGVNCYIDGKNEECTNSWLTIDNNNILSSTFNTEYTMTNSGYNRGYGTVMVYEIMHNGFLSGMPLSRPEGARPVFYLQPTINLFGTGNIDDPLMIQE